MSYQVLSEIDHVLKKSGMYISSNLTSTENKNVYNIESGKFIEKRVFNNPGLLKVIYEVLDNAYDQTLLKNDPTTIINVEMDSNSFTVSNNGKSIPVVKMDKGNDLIPFIIFGKLRSGNKFEGGNTIGTFGLGVKLSNIFSSKFEVTCFDKDRGLKFEGIWKDNMKKVEKNKVGKCAKNPKFSTVVQCQPDLTRFDGITDLMELKDDIVTKLVVMSHTHANKKLKIMFNGQKVPNGDFKKLVKNLMGYENAIFGPNDSFAVCSSDEYKYFGIINGQNTSSANSNEIKAVTCGVIELVRKKIPKATPAQVKNKIAVFANITVKNATYSSQVKSELTSRVKLDFSKFSINKLYILERLKKEVNALDLSKLNKSTKSISREKTIENYDPSIRKGSKCSLYIAEGLSAKSMVSTGLSVIKREFNGIFPIKGKLLNSRGATIDKVKANAEIMNIIIILGLQFGETYNSDEKFKALRYGRVVAMFDADLDSFHILGLLLNTIAFFWPKLLERGFVKRFVTPQIKCGNNYFYNSEEFEKATCNKSNAQHLKGLGTSEREDTLRYFKNIDFHLKDLKASENTLKLLNNVFNPSEVTWRKNWLTSTSSNHTQLDYKLKTFQIDEFINTELRQYSQYDIVRSIPSVIDGLKRSQRQALYGALFHFEKTKNNKFKVAQLSGVVAAKSHYAHGEISLQQTIVNMAQSFPGSNNLPLFNENGSFGSRLQNGNDAASARYIYTQLRNYTRDFFSPKDDAVLSNRVEEGHVVEPEHYAPALPLILLNGSKGIGTGFSTEIPCFNIDDIRSVVQKRITKTSCNEPLPYYNGYKANDLTVKEDNKWVFTGKYTKLSVDKLAITELPIGVSIDGYKNKTLSKLAFVKKVVVNHVDENRPRFEITTNGALPKDIITAFKLRSSISSTNMHCLNKDGKLQKYNTITEIVDAWLEVRNQVVTKRKANELRAFDETLSKLTNKIKFIHLVVSERIILMKRRKQDIVSDLRRFGVTDHNSLLALPIYSLTLEKMDELEQEKIKIMDQKRQLQNTTVTSIIENEAGIVTRKRKRQEEEDIKFVKVIKVC